MEPICCSAPLPQHGVDILSLLKLRETSSRFHLQLTPTTVSEALDALIMPTDPDDFDELKIMRDMARTFRTWSQDNVISLIGLDGINITSVPKGLNTITSTTEDEDDAQHEILIKFIMRPGQTEKAPDKYRLHCLNKIIFASELSKKTGVKLKACFDTGVAKWKVRCIGVVDTCWTARAGGSKISRRLMKYCYSPGYKGESLD